MGERPMARANHSGSIVGSKLYIFGGCWEDRRLNDLWCLDLTSLNWTCILVNKSIICSNQTLDIPEYPISREGHTMCNFKDRYLLIFGGLHEITNEIADLIEFDTETKVWKFHEREIKDKKQSSLYDIFNSVGKFVNNTQENSRQSMKSSIGKRSNSQTARIAGKSRTPNKLGKPQINLASCDKNSKNFTFANSSGNPSKLHEKSVRKATGEFQSAKSLNSYITKCFDKSGSPNKKTVKIEDTTTTKKENKFVISTPKASEKSININESIMLDKSKTNESIILNTKKGNDSQLKKEVNFAADTNLNPSTRSVIQNLINGSIISGSQRSIYGSMAECMKKKAVAFKKKKQEDKTQLLKQFDVRDKHLKEK